MPLNSFSTRIPALRSVYGKSRRDPYHSSKHGISEFMYFISGAGTITRATGEVIAIKPDTYVSLPDGSEVVWDVTETSRKIYIITQTTA